MMETVQKCEDDAGRVVPESIRILMLGYGASLIIC